MAPIFSTSYHFSPRSPSSDGLCFGSTGSFRSSSTGNIRSGSTGSFRSAHVGDGVDRAHLAGSFRSGSTGSFREPAALRERAEEGEQQRYPGTAGSISPQTQRSRRHSMSTTPSEGSARRRSLFSTSDEVIIRGLTGKIAALELARRAHLQSAPLAPFAPASPPERLAAREARGANDASRHPCTVDASGRGGQTRVQHANESGCPRSSTYLPDYLNIG